MEDKYLSGHIVIVSAASISALGRTTAEAVAAMVEDRCGIREPSSLEQMPREYKGVGEARFESSGADDAFRAERLLGATIADALGRDVNSLLSVDANRNAAVIGTTVGGMRHCGVAMRLESAGDVRGAHASYARTPAGTVLRRALRGVPIGGPRITVSCACASGLSAIAHGCALLRSGAADVVVAGGYDPTSEFVYGGFSALQLVAAGPLSPFAKDREGMKLGEGCAIFVLRRAEDVARNGLRSIATIDGIGESSDAFHLTHPHPSGAGAAAALAAAIASCSPDLILAHATGTEGNDAAEFQAYRSTFVERLPEVPIVALKSRLGHPLAAAGALELSIAIEASAQGVFPSGTGRAPDLESFPGLRLLHGPAQPGAAKRIVALAAGFGGANAAVGASVGGTHACADAPETRRSVAIGGWGAVCSAGRGAAGLSSLASGGYVDVPDGVLAGLIDRTRHRRIAMLPRLMIAAIKDLCSSAALEPDALSEIPVLCATWHGAAGFTEHYYRDLVATGIDLANPLLFAESVPNVGSGHVSIGFGITAPCSSVVGSRNAGLEACALACARISSRAWNRAIVVAGDESLPLIDAVLGSTIGKPVRTHAAAVALLLESPSIGHPQALVRALPGDSLEQSVTSASPADDGFGQPPRPRRDVPECGAATPLAVAMLETASAGGRFISVVSQEPGGSPWTVCIDPQGESIGAHAR